MKITDKQAREYASGYFEQNEDCARFKIKGVAPSPEANALEVSAYVEWTDGGSDTIRMTCWLEDGQPFGEW